MKKLAIAQIILGVLVVGSVIYWMGWLSTGYLYAEGAVPGTDILWGVHSNPGRATLFFETWPFIYFSLGVVVFGFGIAQYLNARRQAVVWEGKLGE